MDRDRDRGQPTAEHRPGEETVGPPPTETARLLPSSCRSSMAPAEVGGSLLCEVSGDGLLVHYNGEQTACEDLVNLRTERISWPARLESAVVP